MSCSNLRALTRNHKVFLTFYDVSIGKKAKLLNNEFSRVSFSEFFSNFAHTNDTNATFHILFFEKILSEQFSLMVKNKKLRDIGETV